MKKKNFLIILPYWDATFKNKNIGKLLKRLDEAGHNLFMYCAKSNAEDDLKIFLPDLILFNSRPFSDTKLGIGKKGFFYRLLELIKFINVLRKIKEVEVFWTYAGYIENIVLAFFKIPYVLKIDSTLEISSEKITCYSKLRTLLFFDYVLKNANLILAETEIILSKLEEIYGNKKTLFFPNGFDLDSFHSFKSSSFAIEEHKKIYLYTGRILHNKGIDLGIKAFISIAEFSEWELHFVGCRKGESNEYLTYCKNLIKENSLENVVHFHEACFGDDLYSWYDRAEVYILPSRSEGLANVLTEALAFCNPVIAFDVGNTSSILDSSVGSLINPEDYLSFGEAMLMYEKDSILRNNAGLSGQKLIFKDYDDKKIFNDLFKKAALNRIKIN